MLSRRIKVFSDGSIETVNFAFPSNAYIIRNWTNAETDAQFAGYQFDSKPEVRRRYPSKSLTSGENRTDVSGWEQFFMAINYNDPLRYNYITADDTFCFNTQGFPRMASVDSCGNVVLVERVEDGWAKIQTLPPSPVPSLAVVNYELTPWFVHRLQIVTRDYRRKDTPKGDVYYVVVLDVGKEAWMPLEWLVKV